MNERTKSTIAKVLLATVPFLLLVGAWAWNRPDRVGDSTRAAHPSVAVGAPTSQSPVSPTTPPITSMDESEIHAAAQLVLRTYLSNPSPRVKEGLAELQPLVSNPLYTKITNEWKGATTRAQPRVDSLRAVTLTPLDNGMGIKYSAEAIQIVDFPAGADEVNTLSVFMRLKQEDGHWIVYDLQVT